MTFLAGYLLAWLLCYGWRRHAVASLAAARVARADLERRETELIASCAKIETSSRELGEAWERLRVEESAVRVREGMLDVTVPEAMEAVAIAEALEGTRPEDRERFN